MGESNNDSLVELWKSYPYSQDSMDYASRTLKNPFPYSTQNVEKGKYLYSVYCVPCHGEKGDGNGEVGKLYGGVANYNAANLKGMTDGHIYHVITMGKGRMWPHGSQILPEDRWKIVMYVNQLRGFSGPQNTYTGAVNAGGQ
jgi:mono/diheme cytochrome c family protein